MVIREWLVAHGQGVSLVAALIVLAWAVSWVLQGLLSARLRRLKIAGGSILHLEVLRVFVPLVRWALLFAALSLAMHLFELPVAAESLINRVLQAGFTLLTAFAAAAAVDVALKQWVRASGDPAEARTRTTLAPVLGRACLILLVTMAVLLVLQNAGFNVAGLLAGLGIGGLAVALAAKETLANFFGSISLLMDRTFQVGDTIKQGDVQGVVEKIGLRSTRVRTKEDYVVSIPNQLLTNSPVTNMTPHPDAG
jgi:MscS family membrane protein